MRSSTATRARRVPVPGHEPLIDGGWDYADSFAIEVPASDTRSSEEFARLALEQAPWPVRCTVLGAHRYLLRLRLAPRSSPAHVLGWTVAVSEPDVVQLEAESPLLGRGVIVGRRPDPGTAAITTYVFFRHPAVGRAIWAVTGPLHRRVAPYLLERAVATADRRHDAAVVA